MADDVWIQDNPPEDFDTTTNASCTQTFYLKGQEALIAHTVTCTVVDETGGVFIITGTFGADGVLLTLIGGTVKWQA